MGYLHVGRQYTMLPIIDCAWPRLIHVAGVYIAPHRVRRFAKHGGVAAPVADVL